MTGPVPNDLHRPAALGYIREPVVSPEVDYVAVRAVVVKVACWVCSQRIEISPLGVLLLSVPTNASS